MIEVDARERSSNGKKVIQHNSKVTNQLLLEQKKLKEEMQFLESHQELLLEDHPNDPERVIESIKTQDAIKRIMTRQGVIERGLNAMKPDSNYQFPSLLKVGEDINLDIKESKIYQRFNQGDFIINNYLIELCSTWMNLHDKIKDVTPLSKTRQTLSDEQKWMKKRLLICLPNDEDRSEWFARSDFTETDYKNFKKKVEKIGFFIRELKMPREIYPQPTSSYFNDIDRSEALFKEKQRIILAEVEKITSKKK